MVEADVRRLRRLFLDTFVRAWPTIDVPVDRLSEVARVWVEEGDEPMLWANILGAQAGFGYDGSIEGASRTVVALAQHLAEEAENDRIDGGPYSL